MSIPESNLRDMKTLQANRPSTMAHGARPNKFLKNYINSDISSKASTLEQRRAPNYEKRGQTRTIDSEKSKDVSWKIVYQGCNFTVNTKVGAVGPQPNRQKNLS